MHFTFDRRLMLQGMALASAALPLLNSRASAKLLHHTPGWVEGKLTGAQAVVETMKQEGTCCVFGIPGAQENELWDAMKSKGLPYLLVTHEFSAAAMADGYARSTGKAGVMCVVPGPGVTNSLTGLGEALIDSIPIVCIVGDIAQGEKYRPFQVHCLDQVALLKPVTKGVYNVTDVSQIPNSIRCAFQLAMAGEPGPVAVVIPYTMLIDTHHYKSPPLAPAGVPFDEQAFDRAVAMLANRKMRVGIYAGLGCMDHGDSLAMLAEVLQAPVATSVSGKGVIPDTHPLSVGWGYGPQATMTAEKIFKGKPLIPHDGVDCVLAIGVRYSEVSTGFYSQPKTKHLIHADANADNLGKVMKTDVCVHADAGVFIAKLLEKADCLRRPADAHLVAHIRDLKAADCKRHSIVEAKCGADPMSFVLALRRAMPEDGMLYVDVTVTEHFAAEAYRVCEPRTYFNPTDNQSMGWSIPAAIGGQKAHPKRTVATITGDGCFLMSAMEVSTAARECLPVKFFILDDQAYHYMQMLQLPAYLRTTATMLAKMDYESLARAFGVSYLEIKSNDRLEDHIRAALTHPGPIIVRVITDYRERKVRWIEAVRQRFTKELSAAQKARFLARIGSRSVTFHKAND
ncbi:MAG: thiamine pyrophosphate-binding protein [Planctomycetes bacterium]|nr:thiamine pyrophosphate-binding protein [Planctomycetota bacterium]